MTPEYKSTLLDVYRTFYSKEIVEFIANRILRVGHPRFTANYFLGLKDQIILEKFFTFRFRVINWKVFFQRLSRQSALRLIRKIGKNLSGRV